MVNDWDDDEWSDDPYDDEPYEDEEFAAAGEATIICPECGSEVYDELDQCPECGYFFLASDRTEIHSGWRVVAIVLVIVMVLSVGGLALVAAGLNLFR